jgi:sec-independent protein translocase protein TatB
MFDFAWSEIALIGVVALIAIGPKDMPVAIKTVADLIKKARKMAGEFQTHVDEMVREANLSEVRTQINEIRNLDIKGTIERAVDGDGSIRRTFQDDPFKTTYTPPAPTPSIADTSVAETPAVEAVAGDGTTVDTLERPANIDPEPDSSVGTEATKAMEAGAEPDPAENAAPAFIPPSIASPPVPPAFIPPGTRSHTG